MKERVDFFLFPLSRDKFYWRKLAYHACRQAGLVFASRRTSFLWLGQKEQKDREGGSIEGAN
ncbi:MAG: hypothetical protein CMP59_04115 [Flavobacteriales bacterium]|nr:hypothetical protein [Flavobacteriales bacterium]|tara:strand:- start:178 stop:363 length:186 start_codon:yes stop_codon:yes gene_type:complete